jgi:hypothetical protein
MANPGEGRWSAAELVAHLITAERAILSRLDKLIQMPPSRVPLLKRFHIPLAIVEARIVRRKTPVPTDRQMVQEKEAMLAELRGVRERTLALIYETKPRDLRAYRWRHPFLGYLNVYEWFEFIACHEIRHEKQMREIGKSLPKAIASLQK